MAASNGSFAVVIKAVDQASATIAQINKKISTMQTGVAKQQDQLKGFADQGIAGLKKIEGAFGKVSSAVEDVTLSIGRLLPVFGVLAGGALISGLASIISGAASAGSNLALTAEQIGISTDRLYQFEKAAELAGSSAADMDSSLQAIASSARLANLGLDPMMRNLADLHHIDLTKSPEEILKQVLEVSKGWKGTDRAAFLNAMHVNPSLERMGDDPEGYLKKAAQFKPPDADKMVKLKESIVAMQTAFESLSNELVSSFAPQLTALMDKMTAWLSKDENKKWLFDKVKELEKDIEDIAPKLAQWIPTIKEIGAALELYIAAKFAAMSPILRILAGLYAIGEPGMDSKNWPTDSPLWGGAMEAHQMDLNPDGTPMYPNSPQQQAKQAADRAAKDTYSSLPPGGAQTNAKTAYAMLRAKGYSDENIAGILANMQHESTMNPYASQGGGAHLGLMQWDAGRQADFASIYHHAINDPNVPPAQLLKEQIEFIDYELKHKYKGAADAMRGQSADTSGNVINDDYEVLKKPRNDGPLAEDYLKRIQSGDLKLPVPPIPPTTPPPPQPMSGKDGKISMNIFHSGYIPPGFGMSINASGDAFAGAMPTNLVG